METKREQEAAFGQRVDQALEAVRQYPIASKEEYEDAQLKHVRLNALVKEVEDYWAEDIDRAFKLHRSLTAKKNDWVSRINLQRAAIYREIKSYEDAQEKIRLAQEEELQRQAKAQQDEMILKTAESLEKAGRTVEANALLEQAPEPIVPVLPSRTAHVPGFRNKPPLWRFKVENPALVPDEYWVVDEQLLGRVIRARSGKVEIPGVRVWDENKNNGRL